MIDSPQSPPRPRGRPKGTGLDDSATLAALRDLLARTPNLKPTTAIKQLGISNPSTIRRLRDKLDNQTATSPAPIDREVPAPSRAPKMGDTTAQYITTRQSAPSSPAVSPGPGASGNTLEALRLALAAAEALTRLQQHLLETLSQQPPPSRR